MAWDCLNRGREQPEGCWAVSGLPPTWLVLNVCNKHERQIQSSLRDTSSKDVALPYEIVVVHNPSYEEKRGPDWDELQRTLGGGYETLIVGTDRRIAGKHIFILRRILSRSTAYDESELLAILGPATETGVNDVPSSAANISERFMRWDCSRGGTEAHGGCVATSTGEAWFLNQVCDKHEQRRRSPSRHGEEYQVLLVNEDSSRHRSGKDWDTLQERLSEEFEVVMNAQYHQIPGFCIYVLQRTSMH